MVCCFEIISIAQKIKDLTLSVESESLLWILSLTWESREVLDLFHLNSFQGRSALCKETSVKFIAEPCLGYDELFLPLRSWAEEIESDSCVGVELALFCLPSSAGTVCSRCCRPLGVGSHSGVVLGKGAALLPGGSCWQRQFWLCASSKSYSISCPFCPANCRPPLPRPNGPHPVL